MITRLHNRADPLYIIFMDDSTTLLTSAALYDGDFHAWCMEQAAHLRERARPGVNDGLDYENLAEEIESLARSDRRAIKSHMRVLQCHLLKWQCQPEKRSDSWERTIYNARIAIADLVEDSPSLSNCPRDVIAVTYQRALRDAAIETGLPGTSFPATCPFSDTELLDLDFMPPELEA